jgi:hypothetical protein
MQENIRFVAGAVVRIAVAAAFSYLAYRLGGNHKSGLILVALSAPLWGVLLAKPILAFAAGYVRWAKQQPYTKWQGRYYEFFGTHVRVEELDGSLWFMERDILRILGRSPGNAAKLNYGEAAIRELEGGELLLSEAAAVGVASRARHPDAGKLRFWLEREVIAPHHRKREIVGLPNRSTLAAANEDPKTTADIIDTNR